MNGKNHDTLALDAYLAEYNSLRGEVMSRVQTQSQALTNVLIVIGVAITILVAGFEGKIALSSAIVIIGLFLPLVTFPLAFIFFDAEIMIHAIGSLIYHDLRLRVAKQISGDDKRVFESIIDFRHLDNQPTKQLQHWLSVGRWGIFVVTTFFPTLGIAVYTITEWDITTVSIFHILGFVLFAANCVAGVLLLRAMRWTLQRCEELDRHTPGFKKGKRTDSQSDKSLTDSGIEPGKLSS
jgi:hypothetical protein